MRHTFLLLCLLALLCSGCSRTPPAAVLQANEPPKATADGKKSDPSHDFALAPETPIGEDEQGKVVPAARLDEVKQALKDPDPTVRRAALQALAKVRWRP